MRRETRFKLLRLKNQLIELVPFVAIAAAIACLVWAILNWSAANNEISKPALEENRRPNEEPASQG